MHVLVTTDTLGGVWTYTRELVTGLVRRGIRVTLVSFGDIPRPAQSRWIEALHELDYRPTAFRLEWMQEAPEEIGSSTEYLERLLEEVKPDLCHFNQYCYGALRSSPPRVVVAHSDVVSWWWAVEGEDPPDSPWMRWYRRQVHEGLAGASAVVAPSQWMLEAIERHYFRPRRAEVIYNGRSPRLFNPRVSKEKAVLAVGRLWDRGKRISLLVDLEQPIPVWIAGSLAHPDPAAGAIAQEVPIGVELKGMLGEAELRQLYARARYYAATSRYEPFGLAPLEAALSRCAILASDIPSLHEIWGDTVVYFRDSDSLRSALARLEADETLALTYASLAYSRAKEMFPAERMVEAYVALYRSLLANPGEAQPAALNAPPHQDAS